MEQADRMDQEIRAESLNLFAKSGDISEGPKTGGILKNKNTQVEDRSQQALWPKESQENSIAFANLALSKNTQKLLK